MPNSSFVRTAGFWLIVGSVVGIGVGLKEAIWLTPFGTIENVMMQLVVLVANALTLFGVLGFARSGMAGESWQARCFCLLKLL